MPSLPTILIYPFPGHVTVDNCMTKAYDTCKFIFP